MKTKLSSIGNFILKFIHDAFYSCKVSMVFSPLPISFVSPLQVVDDSSESLRGELRKRLTGDDPDLTKVERLKIRQFLEAFSDDLQ